MHGVKVRTTLGARFRHICRSRIRRTPIQGSGVRVNPEEALVPALAVTLANGLASVLVQELADHGLSDRVDNRWICGRQIRAVRSSSCIHSRVRFWHTWVEI